MQRPAGRTLLHVLPYYPYGSLSSNEESDMRESFINNPLDHQTLLAVRKTSIDMMRGLAVQATRLG